MRALLLTLTMCLFILPAYAKYSGGMGEPNDPYQIATAADLIALGETPEDYDKQFILTADIDLDPNLPGRKVFDKAVIAPDMDPNDRYSFSDFQGTYFSGVFDGNGHTISHLTIRGKDYLGLLGKLDKHGTSGGNLRNLGVVNVNVVGSGACVGGLMGVNFRGNITTCYSTGIVSGDSSVGGLVGVNCEGHITTCYSTAAITGNEYVGGLIGVYSIEDVGSVTRCYSTGSVSGNSYVGGLIGGNDLQRIESGSGGGPVKECYSTGAVSGTSFVGGLVGYDNSGTIITCFWDIQTSCQATSAGGTGKTTAEMQDPTTFTAARWDFVGEIVNGTHEVWQMPEGGGYPVLAILKGYTPRELQGLGTPENPYLISDALELGAIRYYSPEAHYRLGADIDLAGIRWTVAVIPSLGGTFDGNGHTISHLMIDGTLRGGSGAGLFGQLVSEAEVRDLGVTDVNIIGSDYEVGALVGSNGSWDSPGASVTRCYSTGRVSGPVHVGGLMGYNGGNITASYSTASVSGGSMVGGLVGCNQGSVTASYSTGSVTGSWEVGGLVGSNWEGSIGSSYSSGSVTGWDNVGGLVGSGSSGVLKSVWDMETSGQVRSAAGVGLSKAEMMDPHMLGLNGFANDPNWVLDAGRDYPRLAWEGTPGGIIAEPTIDWLEGQGTHEDPYRVNTADQLVLLGRASILWDKHFVLRADINLDPTLAGGQVFGQAVILSFTGVFDGNGHTISHLTIKSVSYVGLFGRLESGGEVKNLGVVDVNITGSGYCIGGLVGLSQSGSVTNCYSAGTVSGTGSYVRYVGGLVGCNQGSVTASYSTGSVTGTESVGGLVGYNWEGSIGSSYSTGSVTGNKSVGGLVGYNWEGSISSSYSTGAVSGYWSVGGLVGYNSGTVSNSYSTGAVSGYGPVGGLVGENYLATVTQCFWDTQTSGKTQSAGGTGKTTAEMQTAKTFLDAGWDFVGETANGTEDIWWILEGKDYPRLSWQGPAGIVFVAIPAGTFQMGNHDGGGADDARPVHSVTLDSYQISKYEAANSQYAEYLNAAMVDGLIRVVNGLVYASSDANLAEAYCDTYASSSYSQIEYSQGRFAVRSRDGKAMSDHPVARVSWYGSKAFCDYYGCRLPTEAEWEYAARGGYHDPYYRYPWGSNIIDCSKANCKTDSGPCNPLNLTGWPYTSPVGYYGPQGAYGLCDMSGNLWEWCQDWYNSSYYSVSPASNPTGPAGGTTRVLRGGAWDVHGNSCDVAGRSVASPDVRGQVVGFRVCR